MTARDCHTCRHCDRETSFVTFGFRGLCYVDDPVSLEGEIRFATLHRMKSVLMGHGSDKWQAMVEDQS